MMKLGQLKRKGSCVFGMRFTEWRCRIAAILLLTFGGTGNVFADAVAEAPVSPVRQTTEVGGIRVTMEVSHAGVAKQESFQEGDPVKIAFTITDASSAPVPGASPLAWLDLRRPDEIPAANSGEVKVAKLRSGNGYLSQPERDLNANYILALNTDATISVVDAQFGFGSSKLLALVPLEASGYDWAAADLQSKIFVSIPEKGHIAVVETVNWTVETELDPGITPTRIVLQPDGHYLWIAGGGVSQNSLVALRTDNLQVAGRFSIGAGSHDIVVTADNRFVFVTNGDANSVSVIDARTLQPVQEIETGKGPVSLAYAKLANAVYVSQTEDGSVAVLDAEKPALMKTIHAEPGLANIAADPTGRYLMVANRKLDTVQVIDSSSNEIIQSGPVGKIPFQVSFTDNFAYVNHIGSAEVVAISLRGIGTAGQPISKLSFPGGEHALGTTSQESPAPRIVQASTRNGVLVANTKDKEVFLYEEGMAAPRGSFTNYDREPLAVRIVDWSLRERGTSGRYETVTTLPKPGVYDVAFYLDSPKVSHCFEFKVASNPAIEKERNAGKVIATHVLPDKPVTAGQNLSMKFRLVDRETGNPVAGLTDVVISSFLAPGVWHTRDVAHDEGEGIYSIEFKAQQAGVYYANIQCHSRKLEFGESENCVVRVLAAANATVPEEDSKTAEK